MAGFSVQLDEGIAVNRRVQTCLMQVLNRHEEGSLPDVNL